MRKWYRLKIEHMGRIAYLYIDVVLNRIMRRRIV